MTQSPTIGALAAALAKAQKAMRPAVFDRTNPHFKNKYATLTSIMEAIRAPMADNGIALLQAAESDGPVVKVTMTLAHSSGEWVSSTLSMTAAQNTPQGLMAALTYCRRGSLSLVCAVSDDDDDGETASRAPHREEAPPPAAPPAPRPGVAVWNRLASRDKGKARASWEAAIKEAGIVPRPPQELIEAEARQLSTLLFGEATEAPPLPF